MVQAGGEARIFNHRGTERTENFYVNQYIGFVVAWTTLTNGEKSKEEKERGSCSFLFPLF
jgi:hypothetical protein